MDDLFSANYMALPSPDLFGNQLSPTEAAQAYAIGLDRGYESRKQTRTRTSNSER